jgi:hypothetical protein
VPAKVGRVNRHDDQVAGSRIDLLVATGAAVGLRGLEGMDAADRDFHPAKVPSFVPFAG